MTNSYSLEELPINPEETPVEMDEHAELLGSIYKELGGRRSALFMQIREENFLIDTSDQRIRDGLEAFQNAGFMEFSEDYSFEGLTGLGSLAHSVIEQGVMELRRGELDLEDENKELSYSENPENANLVYDEVGDIFEALGKGGLEILYGSITDQNKPLQIAVERDQGARMNRYASELSEAAGLIDNGMQGLSSLEPEMVTERGLEIYANIVEPDYVQVRDFFEEE